MGGEEDMVGGEEDMVGGEEDMVVARRTWWWRGHGGWVLSQGKGAGGASLLEWSVA